MLKFMIPAMLSAGFAIPIAANEPPTLRFEQGCREAANSDPLKQLTLEGCLSQERSAQDELKKDWATFSATDRSHCHTLTNIGGMPSYVEFLVCLQMSRDARALRQQQPATDGMGLPTQPVDATPA